MAGESIAALCVWTAIIITCHQIYQVARFFNWLVWGSLKMLYTNLKLLRSTFDSTQIQLSSAGLWGYSSSCLCKPPYCWSFFFSSSFQSRVLSNVRYAFVSWLSLLFFSANDYYVYFYAVRDCYEVSFFFENSVQAFSFVKLLELMFKRLLAGLCHLQLSLPMLWISWWGGQHHDRDQGKAHKVGFK